MMYGEFTARLDQVGVAESDYPTIHDYAEFIEPVYTYHPVFDVANAKEKCAQLYAVGGLGIFTAMRDVADLAKEQEEEYTKKLREFEKIQIDFEAARANFLDWKKMVRNEWRCA